MDGQDGQDRNPVCFTQHLRDVLGLESIFAHNENTCDFGGILGCASKWEV